MLLSLTMQAGHHTTQGDECVKERQREGKGWEVLGKVLLGICQDTSGCYLFLHLILGCSYRDCALIILVWGGPILFFVFAATSTWRT
jgi:hypothetical protein